MDNQRLQATVERVVFFNPESGYAVVRVHAPGQRDLLTVVGRLSEVHPGEVLVLEGNWAQDPRYGRQFQARTGRVQRPADLNGMLRYLGSGLVPGLGPLLARRIVDHFGEQTLSVLDEDPGRVREVPGIGAARARALAEAWRHQREVRRLMEWLRERGVSTLYAARLLQVYGTEAASILSANPYRLALEVPGFGFVAADQLGRSVGVRPDSPVRVQAGSEWCLHRAADEGDCFLPYRELCTRAAAALTVDRPAVEAALGQLAAAGRIYGVAPEGDSPAASATVTAAGRRLALYAPPAAGARPDTPVYLSAFEHAESGLAKQVSRLVAQPRAADRERTQRWIDRYQAVVGVELAPEQREALLAGAQSGLLLLAGGPGTGKTTTLRALCRLLSAMGRSVALAAPTGKAARRLAEVTGVPASTVHRLLGVGRDGREPAFHEENPLPFDALIVDESSMLDLFLAYSLVRAVRPEAQLVMVGDVDQLPSVGPGQVLRDLLTSEVVTSVRLTRVFRQAAASRIVTAAHEVRQGTVPSLPGPDHAASDLWLVEVPPGQAAAEALSWAVAGLPQRLRIAPAEVQVLSAQVRGPAGTEALNAELQARLNPAHAGVAEWFRGALPLRQGDRVIHTANNYRLEVFNGETGQIARIDPGPQTVSVDYGDREVVYSAADVVELQHAYALTVHRAQGSEWPAAVVVLSADHARTLGRNLLYTALTRARRGVVLVAERGVLVQAVANDRAALRRTGLARRLQGVE